MIKGILLGMSLILCHDGFTDPLTVVKNSKPYANSLINQAIFTQAEKIAQNPQDYASNQGYCNQGECFEEEKVEHEDMIQTTTVLEDVLGGGQSYSGSGVQAQIYTGKAMECKKDNWFTDECHDRNNEVVALKKNGLCHLVGHYKDRIRVTGVVVRVDEYKSYCCFPSKLARLTQEGARPQLGLTWGSAKHPSCMGLSPDQFSRLDFSKINLSEIHQDIQKRVVLPSQNKLSTTPHKYIEKGRQSL